jgi:hypothetical protein
LDVGIYEPHQLEVLLSASTATLTQGLSDSEFEEIEGRFGFKFGPDHREFLATTLPIGDKWPDWRGDTNTALRSRLDWPADGLIFDIEHNQFWPPSWGPRPVDTAEAIVLGRERLRSIPVLVPVYGHRYLPAAPCEPLSPVFSVQQSDTIYYGCNLVNYLKNEFGGGIPRLLEGAPKYVAFWSELAEGREGDI